MTLLVATAMADTPDALVAAARRAAREADWVEVRLDGPSGLPWDLRPFFQLARPCIATVRHADDGGRSHADDATRAALLSRAIKSGARAIDVEAWSEARDALVREAHDAGARVILSRHDLVGTPSADQMLDELREMRAAGADWCKLATTIARPEDAAALVEAAQRAREDGIPCALMAVNDPFLRLLAPSLGLALAYGAPAGQAPAAPGQLPLATLRAAHARATPRRAGGATRLAALLGHPVAHSKSPRMQNAALAAARVDAHYVALDVAPDDLALALDALQRTGALGANVTVPHKVAAAALVDELAEGARVAGAVNTIEFRDGRRVGHNTDGAGALDALAEAGFDARGKTALVLGAGGAARGIAHALAGAGAQVILANRTTERAQAVASAAGALWLPWDEVPKAIARAHLLVNATTVGLHDDATPIDPNLLAVDAVLDAVYRAGETSLVREARARGIVAVPGETMLLHQGARAFEIWTKRQAPVAAMRAALREEGAR